MKKVSFFLAIFVMLVATNVTMAQSSIMDFYKVRAAGYANPEQPGGGIKCTLIKQDVKNGFVSFKHDPSLGFLIGCTSSREDMAYFVAKNGKKFVALSSMTGCNISGKISWSGEMPSFFELKNGQLNEITDQFISSERKMAITNELSKGERAIFTKIPQFGTTIQIGTIDRWKGESSFQPAYEMRFDVNNGTFKIVKVQK
jgi:hypothetical protein